MQGCEHGEGKSKPEMGLQSLSQGSRIRAWNREGRAGSRRGVPEMETKVCGGMGYMVEDFRSSLGHGDTWIGVPVQCYTECNNLPGPELVHYSCNVEGTSSRISSLLSSLMSDT